MRLTFEFPLYSDGCVVKSEGIFSGADQRENPSGKMCETREVSATMGEVQSLVNKNRQKYKSRIVALEEIISNLDFDEEVRTAAQLSLNKLRQVRASDAAAGTT